MGTGAMPGMPYTGMMGPTGEPMWEPMWGGMTGYIGPWPPAMPACCGAIIRLGGMWPIIIPDTPGDAMGAAIGYTGML